MVTKQTSSPLREFKRRPKDKRCKEDVEAGEEFELPAAHGGWHYGIAVGDRGN
jgi:hypothetical protein